MRGLHASEAPPRLIDKVSREAIPQTHSGPPGCPDGPLSGSCYLRWISFHMPMKAWGMPVRKSGQKQATRYLPAGRFRYTSEF